MKQAEQMLDNLTLCEQPLDIPGNFRAKQRRSKHDDSKLVFPVRKQPESYKTHYSLYFKSKPKARPSSPRPCSPTRRNNPHPSKNFLNWRIPTRVFDYGKEKQANLTFLKSNIEDTYQTFYDDYCGTTRKRNCDINPKMLMEMAKTYGSESRKREKKRRGIELTLNDEEQRGKITLPKLLRKSWSPDLAFFGLPKTSKSKKYGQISPLTHHKDGFQPLFQSWYDAASKDQAEEKDVENAKQHFIQETLSKALNPDAIEAIENWLLNANDEEREIAVQFIKAIILASVENSSTTVKPVTTHHHHHMKKACEVCKKQELETALKQMQSKAREVPAVTELLNPLHPAVLEQKKECRRVFGNVPRKLHRPRNNANRGSLFCTSKKAKGRHFTIHPEWH
ncbi:uncharacterized protein LOC130662656 [Hydractinia symbiolongicarpus]|uniref:uncharacterized protein LOC130662656 n=1 Tax=Hydractinia symbiolongicarpus TaxID=13093 RepID=UPI002549D718|nr:uncharacterized protein LOC130662656 [Hydractinia symbiolongicarpus]